EWAVGEGSGETPITWNSIASGNGSSPQNVSGDVNLGDVRTALQTFTPPPDTGGPTLPPPSPHPHKTEFTVRLVVDSTGSGIPTLGIDRRVFNSAEDSSLRAGFPKRLGTGGEAPIRYADLNGDNTQELIVPTEDGTVHAYEPDGSELSGWPVHT